MKWWQRSSVFSPTEKSSQPVEGLALYERCSILVDVAHLSQNEIKHILPAKKVSCSKISPPLNENCLAMDSVFFKVWNQPCSWTVGHKTFTFVFYLQLQCCFTVSSFFGVCMFPQQNSLLLESNAAEALRDICFSTYFDDNWEEHSLWIWLRQVRHCQQDFYPRWDK